MQHLAIFDWNGTLLQDTQANLDATNAVLRACGLPEITMARYQDTAVFPLVNMYRQYGMDVDYFYEHNEDIAKLWLGVYEDAVADCPLNDGAVELLNWLDARGFYKIVLSNHMLPLLRKDIAARGILERFEEVSGSEGYATKLGNKPKIDRLKGFFAQNGFDPAKSFIIGDSNEEPLLAHEFGMLGIAITGGLSSQRRLEGYHPHYIAEGLDEVPALLDRHFGLNAA